MKKILATIAIAVALVVGVFAYNATNVVQADPTHGDKACKHQHWHTNHGAFSHWNVAGPQDVQGRMLHAATRLAWANYDETTKALYKWEPKYNLYIRYATRTIYTVIRINQSTGTNTIAEVRAKYPVAAGYTVWEIRSYGGNHAYEGNQHINNGLTHSVGHIDQDKHGNHQHCWK